MEIELSDVVIPVNGRDKGKRFVVIGHEGDYVLLADGKGRRVEKPKRKKVRHIRLEEKLKGRIAEKLMGAERIQNSELRRALGEIGGGAGSAVEGKKEVCTIGERRHD